MPFIDFASLLPSLPTTDPPPWQDLKFNPLGLYNLHRRMGILNHQQAVFTQFKSNFLASDIAWFAAGTSDDNSHYWQPDSFHPLFQKSREGLPVGKAGDVLRANLCSNIRHLLFDMVHLHAH